MPWPFPGVLRRTPARGQAGADVLAQWRDELADELLERLAPVRIAPQQILDIGSADGGVARGLSRQYPRARVTSLAPARVAGARARAWPWRRGPAAVAGEPARLPLGDASVDLIVSNLAFVWEGRLEALFRELRRVLRPEGAIMFTMLGPDSLGELRSAWSELDPHAHVHSLPDMHDIGDAMLAAGLRDPVMDVDRERRPVADLATLLRLLKQARPGAAPAPARPGLTAPTTLERLAAAYPVQDGEGRPLVSWEVVFGHAWGASTPRSGHGDAREFHVPIGAIGRRSGSTSGAGLS